MREDVRGSHYKYDTETGRLEISYYNLPNSENKILLNNGTNEYKIIYTYDKINVETTNVELQTKLLAILLLIKR